MRGYIFLLAAWAVVLDGCVSTQVALDGRLEMPRTADGEKIITYAGYSDIKYGKNAEIMSDNNKVAYSVSYDSENLIPRWVAYDLTAEEMRGTAARNGKTFRQDDRAGVPQADGGDYHRSGWTKGHMAPAGDFKWSSDAMNDTFFYTNCCPQDEYFNGTSWERLESRVRDWAREHGRLFIVTGSIIGDAENGRMGVNRVAIPDAFYKAILVKDGDTYKSVAFVMHNNSAPQPYTQCDMSVNELEDITGVDFFYLLDDKIEESVEDMVDRQFWDI